jgi:hypothetical protein
MIGQNRFDDLQSKGLSYRCELDNAGLLTFRKQADVVENLGNH